VARKRRIVVTVTAFLSSVSVGLHQLGGQDAVRTPHEQVKYYRDKAEELRTMASDMARSDSRDAILRVAREYELLADKAEERAAISAGLERSSSDSG
jgi:hypothetical protein